MSDFTQEMLSSLVMLQNSLRNPQEELDPEIRAICQEEVEDLIARLRNQLVMPEPADRDDIVLQKAVTSGVLPLTIEAAARDFLQRYESVPLPPRKGSILDVIETASGIPLVRSRNVAWDSTNLQGSLLGKGCVWALIVPKALLVDPTMAHALWASRMVPCYEDATARLLFSLYTRWDLADTMPDLLRQLALPSGVFLVLQRDGQVSDFLVHLQFVLNTWIEVNEGKEGLSLLEGTLTYAMEAPADVFSEFMPPMHHLAALDYNEGTFYLFACELHRVEKLLRSWNRPGLS